MLIWEKHDTSDYNFGPEPLDAPDWIWQDTWRSNGETRWKMPCSY